MKKRIVIYKNREPKFGSFEIKQPGINDNIELSFGQGGRQATFLPEEGETFDLGPGSHKLPIGKYEFYISNGEDLATALLDVNTLTVYRNSDPKIDEFIIEETVERVSITSNDGGISALILDGPSSGEYKLGTHNLKQGSYSILVERVGAGRNPSITITI